MRYLLMLFSTALVFGACNSRNDDVASGLWVFRLIDLLTYRPIDLVAGNVVSIEVKSVIVDGERPEDIKDIAGPVELPVDYRPYLWVGVIIAVLIVVGVTSYILIRRHKRKTEETPPRPAHEIAYEQLQEIAAANLIEAGEIDRYYVFLSAVVRHYLENRFGLHAPEMTTEEFLQTAASVEIRLDKSLQEHRDLLQDFLTECDLVKFAQYGPNERKMKAAFESAKRFIDETRADLTEVQSKNIPSNKGLI